MSKPFTSSSCLGGEPSALAFFCLLLKHKAAPTGQGPRWLGQAPLTGGRGDRKPAGRVRASAPQSRNGRATQSYQAHGVRVMTEGQKQNRVGKRCPLCLKYRPYHHPLPTEAVIHALSRLQQHVAPEEQPELSSCRRPRVNRLMQNSLKQLIQSSSKGAPHLGN